MLLKFYVDTADNKILCDFVEPEGAILITHEITEDIIEVLGRVIWFDDLPLSVPLDKLYAFLAAENIANAFSDNEFWKTMSEALGDTVPISAYRRASKKIYMRLGD
jgi:hypothetical protein